MSTKRTQTDEVARRAYRLWEEAGRPHGRDLDFWLRAEAQAYREGVELKQPIPAQGWGAIRQPQAKVAPARRSSRFTG